MIVLLLKFLPGVVFLVTAVLVYRFRVSITGMLRTSFESLGRETDPVPIVNFALGLFVVGAVVMLGFAVLAAMAYSSTIA